MTWISVQDQLPPIPEKPTCYLVYLAIPRSAKRVVKQVRIARWEPYYSSLHTPPTDYRWEFNRSVGGYNNINKWSGYVTHWCEIPEFPWENPKK